MNKKEITIAGITYPIDFTMEAIMIFEEVSEKSFFDTKFNKTTDRIALIYAAVMNADKESDITIQKITGDMSFNTMTDIIAAFKTIMVLVNDFFRLPKVTEEEEEEEKTEEKDNGEKPKN